jgi:AbrB family looped-hinge helix DNA binding protein
MLVKITSKNQITIPKKIVEQFSGTQYLEAEYKDGALILKPVKTYETDLESIRAKMKKIGMESGSVQEAVEWARSRS